LPKLKTSEAYEENTNKFLRIHIFGTFYELSAYGQVVLFSQ